LRRFFELLKNISVKDISVIYYLLRGKLLFKTFRLLALQIFSNKTSQTEALVSCTDLIASKPVNNGRLSGVVIDIILPVYNGYNFVVTLIEQIYLHTHAAFRLIVIDDASTDDRVQPFLQQIESKYSTNTILIKNEINIGFVRSVNKAYRYTKNHFVILNTDTEVPPGWLGRLMAPIFKSDNIASTTPFTNSGKICGFPEMGDNPIFRNMSVTELDGFFQYVNPDKNCHEIPTGVGFCMGINREVVEKIGFLDGKVFDKGYGEENDWCMRANKNGFINVIVPNLFVYHKHGGSFLSTEKKKLISANFRKLIKRYPDYLPAIYEFTIKDPLCHLRECLVLLIDRNID